jgi:hypothetical protein
MPIPTTCRDTFNAARAQRAKYPLASGLYKLREAQRALGRWRATIETITERTRGGSGFGEAENLGSCMSYERGAFLTELPKKVAELVGYHILPGIAALGGDSVRKADVQKLLSRAETDAQRLLIACDVEQRRLEAGIQSEYRFMRHGSSPLTGLITAAESITRPA